MMMVVGMLCMIYFVLFIALLNYYQTLHKF